jgi:hypothetical protein
VIDRLPLFIRIDHPQAGSGHSACASRIISDRDFNRTVQALLLSHFLPHIDLSHVKSLHASRIGVICCKMDTQASRPPVGKKALDCTFEVHAINGFHLEQIRIAVERAHHELFAPKLERHHIDRRN